MLEFRDYAMQQNADNYHFRCSEPRIEESYVADEYEPLKLNLFDKPFESVNYEPYAGKYEITSKEFRSNYGDWGIYFKVDNEPICLSFTSCGNDDGTRDVKHSEDYGKGLYRFEPAVRLRIEEIAGNIEKEILPYYERFCVTHEELFRKIDELDGDERYNAWFAMHRHEIEALLEVLDKFEMKLSKTTRTHYKDMLERWGNECPKNKQLLEELLSKY